MYQKKQRVQASCTASVYSYCVLCAVVCFRDVVVCFSARVLRCVVCVIVWSESARRLLLLGNDDAACCSIVPPALFAEDLYGRRSPVTLLVATTTPPCPVDYRSRHGVLIISIVASVLSSSATTRRGFSPVVWLPTHTLGFGAAVDVIL